MAHGPWLMAHGSWLMAHGSWLMAHGSWLMAHGSWLMAHGSWLMADNHIDDYFFLLKSVPAPFLTSSFLPFTSFAQQAFVVLKKHG